MTFGSASMAAIESITKLVKIRLRMSTRYAAVRVAEKRFHTNITILFPLEPQRGTTAFVRAHKVYRQEQPFP
jgi:hypothetical protein